MRKALFCESNYLVDSDGYVLSKKGKPLKASINPKGYKIICVMVNKKRKWLSVHSAVARAFCDGYLPEKQVNHKDGNKLNNHYTNLEWVTSKENTRHSIDVLGKNGIGANNNNSRAIEAIDKKTGNVIARYGSIIDAARVFSGGCERKARSIQNAIWCVIKGTYGKKTYRGCIWRYVSEQQKAD